VATKTVLILGDVHAPWVEMRVVDKFYDHLEIQPDYVIQIGDLYDLYSQSKFARTHSLCTPTQELMEARTWALAFWKEVKRRAPKAKCYQLLGNHDERAKKRLYEKCPELEPFFDFRSPYLFPGVTTMEAQRELLILDGIIYQHGHYTRAGQHAQFNMQSTVHGHTHRGSVFYFPYKNKTFFNLDVGFCASIEAVPMKYTMSTIHKMTHGYGLIDKYGPRFISC